MRHAAFHCVCNFQIYLDKSRELPSTKLVRPHAKLLAKFLFKVIMNNGAITNFVCNGKLSNTLILCMVVYTCRM